MGQIGIKWDIAEMIYATKFIIKKYIIITTYGDIL
jgi:hypothetical protein